MKRTRKASPDEINYYRWSISRWQSSEARMMLNATGRGIYRELLDQCYKAGSIPADLDILCLITASTREQMDAAWPVLSRYFRAKKKDRARLENEVANQFRRATFRAMKTKRETADQNRPKSGLLGNQISDAESTICDVRQQDDGGVSTVPLRKGKERKGKEEVLPLPPPCRAPDIDDLPERIHAIGALWPTTSGLEPGKRLIGQAVAEAVNRESCLATMEQNLPAWAEHYRQVEPRYRKTLLAVMRDGDWMHAPPAESAGPKVDEWGRRVTP